MLRAISATIIVIIILIPFAYAKDEEEGFKVGEPLPKFILKDPDDKEYSLEAILNKDKDQKKAIILLLGDPKVRKEGNEWAKELHKIYGERKEIIIFVIADLRGLPFFATDSMVKWGSKREELPVPILLDWKGKYSEKIRTYRSKPNIYIVNNEGKVAFHEFGSYSEELVKKIQAKVIDVLKDKKGAQN